MTDTTTPTGAADAVLQLTSHELLYLLSLNATAASDTTREQLRLGDAVEEGTPLYAAGATTLAVRELLEQRGQELIPSTQMGAAAALLTNADRWVEIGLVGYEAAAGALIVASGEHAGMLTAGSLGIFTLVALKDAGAIPPMVVRTVRGFLERTMPGAASIKVTDAGTQRRSFVRRGENGDWQVGSDPPNEDGILTPREVPDADVDMFITDTVSVAGDGEAVSDEPA